MNKTIKTLSLAVLMGGLMTMPAQAKDFEDGYFDKDRFQLRVRGIAVMPTGGGSTTIGGSPDADNAFVPEIDLTYFFTQHIAAELIAGTSPHDLSLKTGAGTVDLGDSMILPPTLTLQYHFTPDQKFSPYVGAGINYTLPYAEDGAGTSELQADGSFGYALQAGADYWFNDTWGVNFDVKKIWVDVDASIDNGNVRGNVELNPWVVGTGISYRF